MISLKRSIFILFTFSLFPLFCFSQSIDRKPRINLHSPVTAYVNGKWLKFENGKVNFEKGERYSIAGVLTSQKPAEIDTTINLNGNFVVPPFGEAHNHSVEASWSEDIAKKYLNQGIFYYKNPNDVGPIVERNRKYFNKPRALDVQFAHGGLTIDGGHPEPLYRSLAERYRLNPDSLDGKAFFEVPTVSILEQRWSEILAGNPDFIKLYLLNANKEGKGISQGLSPEVFRRAVELAHESGLRTTVHVNTASDLELAFKDGADESAHLLGRVWQYGLNEKGYRISKNLAEQMATEKFVVVTTTIVTKTKMNDVPKPKIKAIQDLQVENLKLLYRAGVPLAIGTDSYGKTALDEVLHLNELGPFSDSELFQIWVRTAPRSIFPNRAIGELKPGFEASFLSLSCNPTEDINCVEKIDKRVKQGFILNQDKPN